MMMKTIPTNHFFLGAVLLVLLAHTSAARAGKTGAIETGATETGTAIKADALKAEPFLDAKTVSALAVGDQVEILKKEGGWLNVKSAKGKGWVRMLSIRRGAMSGKSAAGASSLTGLASGRAGTGKVVATTGIRGLNEEELKAAKFDETEMKLAESYASSRADAKKFADQGKLKTQKVDYLAEAVK